MSKRKLVKCGERALSFADPYSGFNIHGKQVKELETIEQRRSNKIKRALRGGHLEAATEEDFKRYQAFLKKTVAGTTQSPKEDLPTPIPTAEEKLKADLDEKTKAELTEYYKANYQVSDADVAGFEKLKHDEMVEELLELAAEGDE